MSQPSAMLRRPETITKPPASNASVWSPRSRLGWRKWLGGLLGLVCSGGMALAQTDSVSVENAANSQAASDFAVWSWRGDTAEQIVGVTPMVWIRFNYGHLPRRVGANYHTARPDHEIARDVLNEIGRLEKAGQLPDGKLAFHLWYAGRTHGLMGPQNQPPLFPEDRKPDALAQGGLVAHTQDLMRRVAQRLHLEGVTPDFLVLDYEEGGTTWHLGKREGQRNPVAWKADIETTWQHAGDTMPQALRDPAQRDALLQPWPQPRASILAFNHWADERKRAALRKAVFQPWWEAYGQTLPGSNYEDQIRAWETHDSNGWPQPVNHELAGTWSSPVVYLSSIRGNRIQKLVAPEKDSLGQLAAAWTDQRNRVRAALAWSPDVAPWYSNPDWGRPDDIDAETWRWAWAAGLLHDRKHGVRRMLLWSGEPWTNGEVAFAQRVFAMLHALPDADVAHQTNLQPVPLDEASAWLAGWVQQTQDALAPPPEAESPLR